MKIKQDFKDFTFAYSMQCAADGILVSFPGVLYTSRVFTTKRELIEAFAKSLDELYTGE